MRSTISDGSELAHQSAQRYRLPVIRLSATSGLLGRIAAAFNHDAVRMGVCDWRDH